MSAPAKETALSVSDQAGRVTLDATVADRDRPLRFWLEPAECERLEAALRDARSRAVR